MEYTWAMLQTKWFTLLLVMKLHPDASSPGLLCRADPIPHSLGTLAQPMQAAECCIADSRPALFQDNYGFAIQGFNNCTAQSPFDSQRMPFDTQRCFEDGWLTAGGKQSSAIRTACVIACC